MIAWYLARWFWRMIRDRMWEGKAGGVRSKNVSYQRWDAKGWDKVGPADMEDAQCSAGFGDQSDLGYQGDRSRKSLVAVRAPGLPGNQFF